MREQTLHICRSIEQISLRARAPSLAAVARCLVFITDRDRTPRYDAAFAEVFGEHRPARATVIADLVNPDFLIEIVADVELSAWPAPVGARGQVSSARASTRAPSSQCSGSVNSSGEWLIPFRLGTNSIPAGTWRPTSIAS